MTNHRLDDFAGGDRTRRGFHRCPDCGVGGVPNTRRACPDCDG